MASKPIRVRQEDGDILRGRTIDIVVGGEEKTFSVHEALVRTYSSFFAKAMAGEWKESLQRTIKLPDDEPKILALYIYWLYYGTLPVLCDEPGRLGNSEYLDLVKAYVLGDKLLDTQFQDTAIDAIVEKSRSNAKDGKRCFPGGEVIEYAYRNTTESAPVRDLLVDMYVKHGKSAWLHDWTDSASMPQPFLLSLASKLLDLQGDSAKPIEAYRYHSHGKYQNTTLAERK